MARKTSVGPLVPVSINISGALWGRVKRYCFENDFTLSRFVSDSLEVSLAMTDTPQGKRTQNRLARILALLSDLDEIEKKGQG